MTNRGLILLCDAWDCARETSLDPWQLAVEIEVLRSAGLTNTNLRWLLSQGLTEHRLERTRASDRVRRFAKSPSKSLALSQRDCFILTEAGFQFASPASPAGGGQDPAPARRSVAGAGGSRDLSLTPQTVTRESQTPPTSAAPAAPRRPSDRIPVWDAMLHELRLGRVVVKRFTRPARAQEVILSAFQEECWPSAIDDPLPAQFNQDPKRRLHYTIRNLNRGQHPLCIRFFINGNGETIRWESVPQQRPFRARQRT